MKRRLVDLGYDALLGEKHDTSVWCTSDVELLAVPRELLQRAFSSNDYFQSVWVAPAASAQRLRRSASLSIALQGATLVDGELFGTVKHEDIEWELGEAGGGKELKLVLLKTGTDAPFWPCLVKGHPEVETVGMKKEPMSTEELMAQLQEMGMGGMGQGAMEEMVSKQMGASK